MHHNIVIDIMYDEEHHVYLGSSQDVKGLHVECATLEEVFEVVNDTLPDMLRDNALLAVQQGAVPLYNIAKFAEHRAQ